RLILCSERFFHEVTRSNTKKEILRFSLFFVTLRVTSWINFFFLNVIRSAGGRYERKQFLLDVCPDVSGFVFGFGPGSHHSPHQFSAHPAARRSADGQREQRAAPRCGDRSPGRTDIAAHHRSRRVLVPDSLVGQWPSNTSRTRCHSGRRNL